MMIDVLASEVKKGDKIPILGTEVEVTKVEPSITTLTTFLHYRSPFTGSWTDHIAVRSDQKISVNRKHPDEDLIEAMCAAYFYGSLPHAVTSKMWEALTEAERNLHRAGMRDALAVTRDWSEL